MRSTPLRIIALAALAGCGACGLIDPGMPTYLSNEELFRVIERESGFEVDPLDFELSDAQVRKDAVIFHYRGVAHTQDVAWVCRFSSKSSEQDPKALTDIDRILGEVKAGRQGFQHGETVNESLGEAELEYIPYTFDAPIRDNRNRPHAGRGIVGVLERSVEDERIVFYFNLYNLGDREALDRPAIEPFLREMTK